MNKCIRDIEFIKNLSEKTPGTYSLIGEFFIIKE